MPMSYSGIIEEHKAVRNTAGVFDVSHMGEFKIHGKGAENFLQLVTVNDVKKISNGQAQYSAMCTSNGGIIDDVILYRFNEYFMMVVNAANIKDDFNWLLENSNDEVFIEDISDDLNLIAIQGPKSAVLLNEILECDLKELKYYNFIQEKYNNDTITVSRTGYTGELGFEIYGNNNSIISLWEIIFNYEDIPVGFYDKIYNKKSGIQSKWHHIHYSLVKKIIGKYTKHLDVGCAGGTFVNFLDKNKFSYGADISINQIKYAKSIIQSMTPGERRNYAILDRSRRQRIAKGSGTKVSQVNQLVSQLKMMNQMFNQQVAHGPQFGFSVGKGSKNRSVRKKRKRRR